MPRNEHLVLCSGVQENVPSLKLDLRGMANDRLQISDISRKFLANIPDVLIGPLEVASYIYVCCG